jgi:hypothetical protein
MVSKYHCYHLALWRKTKVRVICFIVKIWFIELFNDISGLEAVLNDLKDKSFFLFKRVDLTGIRGVSVGVATDDKRHQYTGGRL